MLLSTVPRIISLTIIVPVGFLIPKGCSDIIDALGGALKNEPEHIENNLSAGARILIGQSFEGPDTGRKLTPSIFSRDIF